MMPEVSPSVDGSVNSSSSELLDSVFGNETETEQQDTASADTQQQQPEAQADPLDEFWNDDDAEPEQIEQDGRNAYKMSKDRMDRFVAAKKLADGISEFAPSVEAAREHYQRANDFGVMESDFRSPHEMVSVPGPNGEQRQITASRAFMEHWNGTSPEGFGAMAEQIPQFLYETGNTQSLARVENVVLGATINGMYRKAALSGDPDDLAKAQNADFAINGRFREKVDPIQRNQQQESLQQREQQLRAREDRIVNDQWGQFNRQHITGAKQAALDTQLNTIFDKPEVKAGFTPTMLSMLRDKVASEVQKNLDGNGEWARNHQIRLRDIQQAYTQAVRSNKQTNLTPHAKAVVDDYAANVRRVLFAVAKPLFQDATRKAVSDSQASHRKLAASAGKSSPSGAGGPVKRSITPPLQGMNSRQLLDSVLG